MVKMPHWPIPYGKKPIDLGLERVRELLNKLGNPHKHLPPVIHIAGTNGKGSTIAYLKAILEDAGYKVHRYISPHLVRFNERITIAGEEISDEYLYQIMEETRIAAGDLGVTFFEGTTVAAFLAFAKVPADIVLLETGMGGRLDATNVIDNPLLSIITPISDDHMEYLGDTIGKIAYEKAGIIKNNCPCIVGWQPKEAYRVIKNRCEELDAPLFACGEHWNFRGEKDHFSFIDEDGEYDFPLPALEGYHQIINASAVIAALQYLEGFDITYKNIINGLAKTKWPARLQNITSGVLVKMLPRDWELWVDGAHNNAGAQMLSLMMEKWKDKPIYLINGRTRNRDVESFLMHFKDKVECVVGVEVKSEPLAERPERIAVAAEKLGFSSFAAESLKEAVSYCISSSSAPARILVCGSLYLAGDVLLANSE
ncbi:folylpolyglutamate synthase [endosymbiont of Acanthamoeba sp. UWC8]|uniref:bifunctional folylpolyglutamate synthase/dihydrofolate synthase n=1 Tax=endosymbiont of Acanthamoeba sp. UWC8 TaxID=86106 RepID=UPI0004D0B765|nr:folylpolyglutamate synthase/dihydrofolate synthase family protein [endosymbiont of Acanthamoeba sp. UWC8]AIF80862.1 folylpolyglutamate synthase [endosymbiont of Acanthamoeba sp. UWC8]